MSFQWLLSQEIKLTGRSNLYQLIMSLLKNKVFVHECKRKDEWRKDSAQVFRE